MLRTCTRKAYLTRRAHTNLDDFLTQARLLYNESWLSVVMLGKKRNARSRICSNRLR